MRRPYFAGVVAALGAGFVVVVVPVGDGAGFTAVVPVVPVVPLVPVVPVVPVPAVAPVPPDGAAPLAEPDFTRVSLPAAVPAVGAAVWLAVVPPLPAAPLTF